MDHVWLSKRNLNGPVSGCHRGTCVAMIAKTAGTSEAKWTQASFKVTL